MTNGPTRPKPLPYYLAVGVAVVCVVAVGVILVRAISVPQRNSGNGSGQEFSSGVTPEILGEGSGAKGLHIQVMDRDEPDRLSMELRSETIEPLAAQRYSVTEPRVTVYLQDGRVAHTESRTGSLTMPDRSRPPETGRLTSEVIVRLFEPRADGSPPDLERDDPVLTWTGESLTFDSTLGQVSTTEPFLLTSDTFEFRARDAIMSINQSLERLERFSVRQGGTLVYFDREAEPEPEAAPPASRGARQGAGGAQRQAAAGATDNATGTPEAAPEQTPRVPVTTYYQAAMRGEIVLARAGQQIASDRLDLFARTIDGKLPDDAILRFETTEPKTPAGSQPTPSRTAGERPATPPAEAGEVSPPAQTAPQEPADGRAPDEALPPDGPLETTLVWTGPLDIGWLGTAPAELDKEHLVARFTSEESGVVTFADAASDANGRAAMVEYGFTRGMLVLSGPSQGRSVQVSSPSIGQASMGRFELPLGEGRGAEAVDAQIPGPFTVIGADSISRIDSGERARLRLAVRNGRITGELLEAEFVGTAKASDADSWLEADRLLAEFEPGDDGRSRLRRLHAATSVRMDDGNGGSGRCDEMVTVFSRETEQPTPESFVATGKVSFRDQTGRIDSDYLRTELRHDDSGAVEVARVWAEGEALAMRRHTDQIDITGKRMFADADEEYLEVENPGGQARVARGPTVISGALVRLDGTDRSAFVEGAGSFEHRSGRGEQASRVVASWTVGMAFSDLEGKLECVGGVEGVHEPDAFTRETFSAELLRVELTPVGDVVADAGEDQPLEAASDADRQIRTVYAAGRGHLGVGEQLATVESARYAGPINSTPGDDSEAEPALERAFRLSGVEIISDNEAGTLDVPGRGRLFVADLRPAAEGEEPDQDRGAALFDWLGSLHADRNAGTAEMVETVSMSHARAADGSKTLLESGHLWVTFEPGAGESGDLYGGLRSAIAKTEVYLRTDSREMTAALLEYNPETGIARALGDTFASVRVLDRATGSPMTASAMIWDLTSDRVDVVDPSVITIPR